MLRFIAVTCCLLWLTLVQTSDWLLAQTSPEIVSRGKQATALLVNALHRVSGTAFCVDPGGYFVTSAHVSGKPGDVVKLVILPGEDEEKVISGRVIRVDEKADLALLHCATDFALTTLTPGTDNDLFETQQVTVFGYPRRTPQTLRKKEYPDITVRAGRISAVRRSRGQLSAIQLDAVIDPGNSGGPVLDETGQLIGMMAAKDSNSEMNSAIPVSQLISFLTRPDVVFSPPVLDLSRSHEPINLEVRVAPFDGKRRDFRVSMEWSSRPEDKRVLAFETTDGFIFSSRVTPVPPTVDPGQLELVAHFGQGAVQGLVSETKLTLDQQQTSLREVRRILRTAEGYDLELADQRRLSGARLKGLPATVQIGDQAVAVQLLKASEVLLAPAADSVRTITYTLIVSEGDTELLRDNGKIILERNVVLPSIAGTGLLPLGGESPFPAFLEPSPDALYETEGLRTKGRTYVRTRSSSLLTADFSAEIVFELQPAEKNDWGNVAFIGIGTVEKAAYDEPLNCAYLRILPLHVNGEVGLSNRPVDSGTVIGRFRKTGPHLARIRRKGELVTFEVDMDCDGPSPDDFSRTVPDIRAFIPELHEKNTHFFFGGAAIFRKVSFHQSPAGKS